MRLAALPVILALASCTPAAGAQVEARERSAPCVRAHRIWYEDFERGDYARWTSRTYNADWGPESARCREVRFAGERVRSGARAHRSQVTCPSHTSVHRGYGGVQLEGEQVLAEYTNRGVGADARHGMVNTFWVWLDVPYDFANGRWHSFWTVTTDCAYEEEVVTLGLEAPDRRLAPAHVEATVRTPGAPPFPLRAWVRITVYVNAHEGELHVWQDGVHVSRSRFSRASRTLCHWHWGLYASGDNTAITLYEDDLSLWVLDEPWSAFAREPWLESCACGGASGS